jgi:short-subunit dehydrogenase
MHARQPDRLERPHRRARGIAIVTGPTAGIGLLFARRLAERGNDLLLVARDAARLDALAETISSAHAVAVRTLSADLSTEEGIARLTIVLEGEPAVEWLVNNAGFGTRGKVHVQPPEQLAAMLRLQALAPLCHMRAVLPGMLARGHGRIVNVGSVAGFLSNPGNANYNATKAYLRFLTEAVAAEVDGTGVRVQVLCPGFTRTEFHDRGAIDPGRIASWLWLDAQRVVDESIAHIEADRGALCIPTLRYKMIVALLRHGPTGLIRRANRLLRRPRPIGTRPVP